MIYCDSSLLVALVVSETGSDDADRWISAQPPSNLFVSDWVATEIASALALKRRLAELDGVSYADARASSRRLLKSLASVPVEAHHFAAAGDRFVSAPPTGLRAGDALHLAIVVDHGFGLATLDRQFADVARNVGVAVQVIGSGSV